MRTIASSKLATPTNTLLAPSSPSLTTTSSTTSHSPWHSPIPYLFGGLATIMGLIAFALLMLVCSYWDLPRSTQDSNLVESHNKESDGSQNEGHIKDYEEKVLVIMAGEHTPTFLATPICVCHDNNSHTHLGISPTHDATTQPSTQLENPSYHHQH